MNPLKVTAYPAEPVVGYRDGLHLDGPMAYGYFASMSRKEADTLPDEPVDFPLPLATWGYPLSPYWGWRCSSACADWQAETKAEIRRRSITQEMSEWGRRDSVQIGSGRYKPCDLGYPAHIADCITWYAVGNRGEVQRLLDAVPAIGKLTNKGFGRIRSWRVEETSADWSIRGPTGILMRPVPASIAREEGIIIENYGAARCGMRCPYYHVSRQALCLIPREEERAALA